MDSKGEMVTLRGDTRRAQSCTTRPRVSRRSYGKKTRSCQVASTTARSAALECTNASLGSTRTTSRSASTRADEREPGGHMARVVVVGGGYGGASPAPQPDADLDVVLVEPKDAFVHSSAALRAVVDATWQDRVFFPYDRLLTRGRVVQD